MVWSIGLSSMSLSINDMVECPRCGRDADGLHPLPPAVITKEVVEAIGHESEMGDLETCAECVQELSGGM